MPHRCPQVLASGRSLCHVGPEEALGSKSHLLGHCSLGLIPMAPTPGHRVSLLKWGMNAHLPPLPWSC